MSNWIKITDEKLPPLYKKLLVKLSAWVGEDHNSESYIEDIFMGVCIGLTPWLNVPDKKKPLFEIFETGYDEFPVRGLKPTEWKLIEGVCYEL